MRYARVEAIEQGDYLHHLEKSEVAARRTTVIGSAAPLQEAGARRAQETLLEQIGNTPLLRLANIGQEFPNIEIHAKAEWFNPGGSVKDRPAVSMIEAGLASGLALSTFGVVSAALAWGLGGAASTGARWSRSAASALGRRAAAGARRLSAPWRENSIRQVGSR